MVHLSKAIKRESGVGKKVKVVSKSGTAFKLLYLEISASLLLIV